MIPRPTNSVPENRPSPRAAPYAPMQESCCSSLSIPDGTFEPTTSATILDPVPDPNMAGPAERLSTPDRTVGVVRWHRTTTIGATEWR